MEFLKSCGSGVQTLAGWSTFGYICYTIRPGDPDTPPFPTSIDILDELLGIESHLRRERYIAYADLVTKALWVFEADEGAGNFAKGVPNLARLEVQSRGTFKSSNLATQSLIRKSGCTNGSSQRSGSDSSQNSAPEKPSPEIYSAFISAVAGTISFQLAASDAIPLSVNTFAILDTHLPDPSEPVPVSLVQTSTYLSSAGTLVLSAMPSPIQGLLRLSDLNHVAYNQVPLVLAPIFLSGSYLGECDDSFDSESKWQEILALWLSRKGIQLEDLGQGSSWVKVSIHGHVKSEDVLWPKALCFVQSNAIDVEDLDSEERTNSWFQGDADSGNVSQIHAAVQWAQSHQERLRTLQARKQRQQEASLQKAAATSPMSSRAVQYGDSHGPLGVYPTPPDGLSSQQVAASVIDTPAADTPTFFATTGLDLRGITGENDPMRLSNQSGLMQQSPMAMKMNDDLFGEDDFGGEDITDADFSFFDQPDEEEFSEPQVEPKPQDSPEPLEKPPKSPKVDRENDLETVVTAVEGPQTVDGAALDVVQHVPEVERNGPLSPVEIRRRLFPANPTPKSAHKSLFQPLQFNDMSTLDEKYSSSGFFGYKGQKKTAKRERSAEQVRRDISLPKRLRYDPQTSQLILDSVFGRAGPDSDASSVVGDQGSIRAGSMYSPGYDNDLQIAVVDSPAADSDSAMNSLVEVFKSLVTLDLTSQASDIEIWQSQIQNRRVAAAYHYSSPIQLDNDFISIAQIVTEQTALSTIRSKPTGWTGLATTTDPEYATEYDASLSTFHGLAEKLFGFSEPSGLMKYASIADLPQEQLSQGKSQARQPPKSSSGARPDMIAGNPLRLLAPFVRIRRTEGLWDMLPPAIAFWDTFGLAPASGPKNVMTYAIYPSNMHSNQLDQFMKDLTLCYEGSKLGTHSRGEPILDQHGDLIPLDMVSYAGFEQGLNSICSKLGVELAGMELNRRAAQDQRPPAFESFVIYFVNPLQDPAALSIIASGFWSLYNSYRQAISTSFRHRRADLVLQLIPASCVVRAGDVAPPPTSLLQNLTREVYNRCPPSSANDDSAALPIGGASSVHLAEAIPRKINFELTADPPSHIMHDNSQLHVGYARSSSGNWISASFTDNTGRYQSIASYCLSGSRTFPEVANEIWQTCMEIMKVRRVSWRLCIAKAGLMDTEEVEAWMALAMPQQPFLFVMVLTSVDLSPPIHVQPPASPSGPPNMVFRQTAQTPATPSVAGASPDAGAPTPAPTPSDAVSAEIASDPDAHLVDATDETWGVILAHRLNLRATRTEFHQSLSSGLLVKIPPPAPAENPFAAPAGAPARAAGAARADADAVGCVGVHLLWAHNSAKGPAAEHSWGHSSTVSKPHADGVLREYLGHFRNLALLAKVRGLDDGRAGLVPWHVLVAVRAVEGLDAVYGAERWSVEA